MKRFLLAICMMLPAFSLAACAEGYGYGGGVYSSGHYGYGGFYDDRYGPFYDGYWGNNRSFSYRHYGHDRHFRRGDPRHFGRSWSADPNSRPREGSLTPGRDMHGPHSDRDWGHRGHDRR